MKLRLPHTLFRAVMACFAAFVSSSLASATLSSPASAALRFDAPDVEQTGSMLCWAASAADVLAVETGQDAATIYRCITEASGNTPGFVESALSWYKDGARGELRPQAFDGSHTVSRHGFETLDALAAALDEAFARGRAASAMLYARGDGQGMGHAVTVYACEYVKGQLYLSYADSADGMQGVRRAEVVAAEGGLLLAGTDYAVASLTWLGDESQDVAPAAPVGGIMHTSPYLVEYTDMAENRGVYRFAYSPSVITYRNGEPDYSLSVTPDFSSVADMGCYTLLHNGSTQMTVEHNGTMNGSTYTGRYVGEYAQKYSVAGIAGNATFSFGTNNPYVPTHDDYRIERMTRLVTDTEAAAYSTDESLLSNLEGVTVYRVGAGNSGYYDTAGNYHHLANAWQSGMTAGITSLMEQIFYNEDTGIIGIQQRPSDFEHASAENPLPTGGLQGDSGSPVFIYNAETQRMELVATLANADTTIWQAYYSPRATEAVNDYCTVGVATTVDTDGTDATTYYISGAKVREDDKLLEDGEAAAYLRKGTITVNGQEVTSFNGVALEEFSQGTWKKLDADSLTWYTYSDDAYLNVVSNKATDANTFGTDDLVYTSNLRFTADAAEGAMTAHRRIELTEHVDLGIGHVQFSLGQGVTAATYDIGQSSSNYFLSSAGFVVDKGVTVNNYFTYEKGRELRRVGEGVMNVVGSGDNDVLLNIGGGGVTYLNRTDGYGAYSVLVNSRAVLRLADAGQVYNNVTLGANGGVLDFNGNDYRWTSGGARAMGADGKTYFGLTVYEGLNRVETSAIANYAAGTTSTITIERTDNFEFAGAFRDGSTYTGSGSVEMDSRYTMMPSLLIGQYKQFTAAERVDGTSTLKVIYDGGAKMEMTGVYTILTGDSGLEVASGTVSLHGTNTIHAIGSETGTNTNRLQNANDWHYAMAEMNVNVDAGASFELGDHALLIGNVQVESGGSYVMKQAVHSRYEYVEGWCLAEDTYALADYYGHKGNVSLAAGAEMSIRFDEGVATQLSYGGDITGAGSLTVAAGKGSVLLTGENTFSGEKTVESGNLRVAEGAEGDTSSHKWLVNEAGSLAMDAIASHADVVRLVDANSTGVLALTQAMEEQISHGSLIIGAAAGETVHYGSAAASLAATGNEWTLGGGGGTLMVDFVLEGANKLVLGNEYGTGMVVLTNAANDFSGGIDMVGGVTLGYTSAAALGNNVLTLGYGQTLAAVEGAAFAGGNISSASTGVFALSDGARDYDLSQHGSLSLGSHGHATLTGSLTVAEGAAYRLGGAGALTIVSQLSGNHGIVVDGQGGTSSSVIFATASVDTGAVLVRGYDASRTSGGDVTLSFATDNALSQASAVSLQNNAILDLNGTSQSFNNLTGDASSLVYDGKGGNTLTLSYAEDKTLGVRVQAAGTDVVKSGGGTLTLSGENLWKSLSISEGAVTVTDGKALGYLSSGSYGIEVTVREGAALNLSGDITASNTISIAGYGVGDSAYALSMTGGQFNNSTGTLNVTADAALTGKATFGLVNLGGNELTVGGSGSRLTVASGLTAGSLKVGSGAGVALANNFRGGSGATLELDGGTLYVDNGTFSGALNVGANSATIENIWTGSSGEVFNVAGFVSGSSAGSTLKLVAFNHSISFSGGADFAGKVEVGNGVTLNITKDASLGALIREASSGNAASLVVNGATLELTGSGTNFNNATLSLTNGGALQLTGLAEGASLGSISTLDMGSNGTLTLTSLSGYGSSAMMNIGTLSNAGKLQFDLAELSTLDAGTYHLLTSGSNLQTLADSATGILNARREYSFISSLQGDGSYTLDLVIGEGTAAHATWKGTGTLKAGVANATNITTNLVMEDNTFLAMDSLTITSETGAQETLTLDGEIQASAVTYTGAGTMALASSNGGKFADGTKVVLDGSGRLELGESKTIAGSVEMKQGTLVASTDSLNATKGLSVTGSGTLEMMSASHVTAGINIAKDASLAVTFQSGSMADQWGGNLDDNLSGEGSLSVNIGSGNELHLNGDHSAFTGAIEVQTGTLQLGLRENGTLTAGILGARNISVASGASLALSSAATTLAADIAWADGATLQVKDGEDGKIAYNLSGTQTLAGVLNITNSSAKSTLISGDIEGVGSLNFASGGSGAASFILSGDNSYSGGTTINRSDLTVYAAGKNALGSGTIQLQSGTLSWLDVGGAWNGDLSAGSIVLSGDVDSSYTMNSNGYDVTYSGGVSGDKGSFTKMGAGKLTLTNFSYTGATHVQEGTLALGIGKSSWNTGFSGEKNATLSLTSSASYGTALMGSMSGDMAVELSGHFQYMAANTHTGGTRLLSGSLLIGHANALQSGALEAAKGTTVSVFSEGALIVGDSVVDTLTFESDTASLVVGTATEAGSLSFGSISGTNGGRFLLDVFSADSYDRLSGTLTPGSLLNVSLKANELGSYLLVEGDNAGYDINNITLTGTDEAYSYGWVASETGLTLNIFNITPGSANVWAGATSGTWDASSTAWTGGSYDATLATLFRVAEDTAISVAAAVNAASLEAEVAEGATLSFSKEGSGAITASTLKKDGEGTLHFEAGSANNFTTVVVNAGTLSVADGNALGTANISGNGTFDLTGGSIRADLNAGQMEVKNIRLDGGSLTLYSTAYWGTSISGRNIEIVGEDSSLSLEKWANLNASSITLREGGTLCTGENGMGNDGGTIYVAGSGTIKSGNQGAGDIAASISGQGTLTIARWNGTSQANVNGVISDAEGGKLSLVLDHNNVHLNAANTYSGGTTISSGSVTTGKETALGTGAVAVNGGTLNLGGKLSIGSLSGTGGAIASGEHELHVNQTADGAYAGDITGSGTLTKAGGASLELSGTNSMGAINLQAGRLVAASDGALGGASIAVTAGASLYVANDASVSNTLTGGSYIVGAEAGQSGSFSADAATALVASGFTKEGAGLVTVLNTSGQTPSGAITISAGTLAYDAGSSSTLSTVSGSGTFALVGGAVNAGSINVGKLEVSGAVLAYSGTFDGKALEVSGQGAELRMGHWAGVNNSSLLLKDGGQLSMSSSGLNNSTIMVEGSGILAVGETASWDENPLLNVESTITGTGTLYVTDYGTREYTVNVNKAISDGATGALAVSTDQSNLHFSVANSYSGGTTINGGSLVAEAVGALGSGSVTVNGGTLSLSLGDTAQLFYIGSLSGTGGTVDIGKHTLVINQTEDGRFDGSFSGSGSLTKRGDAILELGGSASSANLLIDSGTVRLMGSEVFANGTMTTSLVTLYSGVFDINGQTSGSGADSFMFDVDSGYLAFRGGEDMLVTDSSGKAGSGLGFNTKSGYAYASVVQWGTGTAEIAADIVSGGDGDAGAKIGFNFGSDGSGDVVVSGDIGTGRQHFGIARNGTGSGKLILSGNNGYTGGTDVNAGTLVAASDTALGTGALTVASGATLEIAAGKHISLEGNVTFNAGSTLRLNSLDATTATLATTGSMTLGGGLTLDINGELEAGTRYVVLGGLASGDGISLTGQSGYRYTCSTEVVNGVYYLTTSDYTGGELTWNGSSGSTWKGGNELWRAEGTSGNVGSGSKDSVIFSAGHAQNVTVAESGVRVDSMKVEAAGYSFSGGTVHTNAVTVQEATSLAGGASLDVGSVYTVSQAEAATNAATIGKVSMGADSAANTGFIHGTAEGGLASLDNTVIDIAKGASLEMKNILLSETSRITDDPATVAMENVTVAIGEANATFREVTTLVPGTTLVKTGGDETVSLAGSAQAYSLFCSALDTVNVTGTSLTLDLSGYAASIDGAWDACDYVAISFGQTADSLAHFDATHLSISATFDGLSYTPVYVQLHEAAHSSILYVPIPVNAVPEPTTATLSLLALSMLVARRRRK